MTFGRNPRGARLMPNRSADRSTPMISIYEGRSCVGSCSHAVAPVRAKDPLARMKDAAA